MIEGIVGLPGEGKTLLMVKRMIEAYGKRRRVMANFPCIGNLWENALWADMIEADNTLVCIDEAHMWFSARQWNKTVQNDLAVFQQHRKHGLDLIWSAQHENRIDLALRELTAYVWRVKRLGKLVVAKKVTLDDAKKDKPITRIVFPIVPKLYSFYDTNWTIGNRDGDGSGPGRSALAGGPGPGPVVGTGFKRLTFGGGAFVKYVRYTDPDLPRLVMLADPISPEIHRDNVAIIHGGDFDLANELRLAKERTRKMLGI